VGPVCQREGAREREWLTGGAGFVSEREGGECGVAARARERTGNGPKGEKCGREGEGRRPRHGLDSAQQGGRRAFSFSFYFLIPIFIFVSFPFEQFI
jgi:hypothetical protein